MIELATIDFVPLTEFRLIWRFTNPKYRVLPPEALADVRPLSSSRAASLDHSLRDAHTAHASGETEFILWIDAEQKSDEAVDTTSRELAALPIDDDQRVVVSWDRDIAAETSWRTFRTYWVDFCYPSSDDVAVAPVPGGWVLCYHHWERFTFGPVA